MTKSEAIKVLEKYKRYAEGILTDEVLDSIAFDMAIESLQTESEWIPLSHDEGGLSTDFPYERDGEWVIVTNGSAISVERIKKDAQDHFLPDGRWFELEDVIAWMPLPEPYRKE